MVVVFPAPLGPMNPRIWPRSTDSVSRSRATNDPYLLVMRPPSRSPAPAPIAATALLRPGLLARSRRALPTARPHRPPDHLQPQRVDPPLRASRGPRPRPRPTPSGTGPPRSVRAVNSRAVGHLHPDRLGRAVDRPSGARAGRRPGRRPTPAGTGARTRSVQGRPLHRQRQDRRRAGWNRRSISTGYGRFQGRPPGRPPSTRRYGTNAGGIVTRVPAGGRSNSQRDDQERGPDRARPRAGRERAGSPARPRPTAGRARPGAGRGAGPGAGGTRPAAAAAGRSGPPRRGTAPAAGCPPARPRTRRRAKAAPPPARRRAWR